MVHFEGLFNNRSLYFDAFDQLIEAVYICDTNQNLIYFNKAAERLDGYLLKDVKGQSTYDLYGLTEKDSPLLRALTTERPVNNEEFSYYVNGKEIMQLCNAGPIYEEGRLVGAYTVQRDITMFKDMVEKNISLQNIINRQNSRDTNVHGDPFANIIGNSEAFRQCVAQAQQAAKTPSSIMLIGNTGSGKEVFARAIHEGSNRAKKPFLALNCAAIPESLIESILFGTIKGVYTGAVDKEGILAQAEGGTVFLDEINSMPLASQAKLLRVLEERKIMKLGSNKEVPINIRIISSTNETPTNALHSGHLREDLFYRLSVVQIIIPPLRERKEDIPHLVHYFVEKYNKRFGKHVLGCDAEVMSMFMYFQWPGNVRQLKACIESAMNFADDNGWISLGNLPIYVFEDAELPENRYRQWLQKKGRPTAENAKAYSSYLAKSHPITSSPEPLEIPKEITEPKQEEKEKEEEKETSFSLMDQIRADEQNEIIAALRRHKGNITRAAAEIGVSRQTLTYRMKKYGLK